MRFFPHLGDTGGFFVTVIEKIASTAPVGNDQVELCVDNCNVHRKQKKRKRKKKKKKRKKKKFFLNYNQKFLNFQLKLEQQNQILLVERVRDSLSFDS